MKSRWLAYVLLGSVSLGLGCKGDGGATFLEVAQILPENGAEDIIVDTTVAVRLSAAIDPATLTNGTFFLTDQDGTVVPSMVRILDEPNAEPSEMGTAAELTPNESLDVLTDYTVTVTTGLESTAGISLEEDFTWTFKTIDAAWGEAEWIEPLGAGISSTQEIAVDGQLGAFAVWTFDDRVGTPSNTFVYANRYTRTGLWGEPGPIDDGNGRAARPQVAADGAGNGFAVWERADVVTSDQKIWYNRYDVDVGRWGTAALLQKGEITRANAPSVAADPSGNAMAVWLQDNIDPIQPRVIRAIRYEPATGWGNAVTIGSPEFAPSITDVGMDDQGGAIAVWNPPAGGVGGRVLEANRYTPGLGWGDVVTIKSDENTRAGRVRLDVGANGDAFVIWMQDDDPSGTGGAGGTGGVGGVGGAGDPELRMNIYATRFSGGAWDVEPTRIDKYEDGDKNDPDIAVDRDGFAHAVWSQADPFFESTIDNIWSAQYTPGAESPWGDPVLIEPPNVDPTEFDPATTPRVDVNRAGNVFVVWRQDWDSWGSIWSNRIDPGESWMPANAERIEDFADPTSLPKIAVDEGRHAHSVWLHQSAGRNKVRTNRFE